MGIKNRADHEKIIQLYLEGVMGSEIAERLGYSKGTVSKVLNAAGYSMKTAPDKGKIVALARAGWKVKDIAWDVGVTEELVREVLTKEKGAGNA